MKYFLCTVERIVGLFGRIELNPGIPREYTRGVKTGDELLLSRPDGSEVTTRVSGIPLGIRNSNGFIPIVIDPGFCADSIPVGTVVYHLLSDDD
jgi:hypothetical protein